MPDDRDEAVTFQGATATLHGFVRRPPAGGTPTKAFVIAHGRHQDMDEPMLVALAARATELGLWVLRFNFSFRELMAEPSAGHADEIEDLRAAVDFARETSGLTHVFVAGKGMGAWASVGAATDGDVAGAILLGLSYQGQPERAMALQRLEEFEIPTLIFVGSASERVDITALRAVVDPMPFVELEVVEGANHRLEDASGTPLTEEVLPRCEKWLLGVSIG